MQELEARARDITEAEARAEAAARLAAMPATTEAEAKAKAAGQIVATDTPEAAAKAKAAAAARAALPKVTKLPEAMPARAETEAELEAKRAARLALAKLAAELARAERADRRAAERAEQRRNAVVHSAKVVAAELASPAELAAAAKAAGPRAIARLKAAEAKAEAAKGMGMTVRELMALEAADQGRDIISRPAPEAGQSSVLSPAELEYVAEWTKDGLASPAAVAGRAALEAMGPRASALVLTYRFGQRVTVAKVMGIPDVAKAEARVTELAKAASESAERLAETERAEAAAKATKARQPIRVAEANADRVAAGLSRANAKLAKAEAQLSEAKLAAARPEAKGKVYLPVATLPLARAAEAAELALRQRRDTMPARYADRGPSAKAAPKLTDNTFKLAMAELYKLTEAAEQQAWQDIRLMVLGVLEAKAAVTAAERAEAKAALAERQRAAKAAYTEQHRAELALKARQRRRAAKLANK
jgi:hypothetical protein